VHTTIHILNKGLIGRNSDKTPYVLSKGRLRNVKQFRVFGTGMILRMEIYFKM
jgi:hypothetical protein